MSPRSAPDRPARRAVSPGLPWDAAAPDTPPPAGPLRVKRAAAGEPFDAAVHDPYDELPTLPPGALPPGRPTRAEYERVCEVLTRFFSIVITDSGTGLVHSAMDGTLALADSVVIVGALSVDGAAGAAKTLDWLLARGYSELVADAVVVLGHDRGSEDVDADLVREHFIARCRALVEVPADRHLAAGGRIQPAALSRSANQAYLELAANVADSFGAAPMSGAGEPADGGEGS